MTKGDTPKEIGQLKKIESVLFPQGVLTESEKNDIEIVFNAWKYGCTLVTNDGALSIASLAEFSETETNCYNLALKY